MERCKAADGIESVTFGMSYIHQALTGWRYDRVMVVAVPAYRIACMTVPKAASSTVKEMLARVDPAACLPAGEPPSVKTWHAVYPTRRFRRRRWNRYSDFWRFCVIRDPLRRLLSVYTNRVLEYRDTFNSRKLRDDPAFSDLPRSPDADTFFRHLDRYRRASSSIRHHVMPASLFLGPDLGLYDRVFTTAHLNDLAAQLSEKTGQRVALPRANVSGMALRIDDLSAPARDAIRAHLAEEYDYLSGYYENPFGPPIHPACALSPPRVS